MDNLFAYEPLPYVENMYYLDVNFYRYFIGRDDQSVNEKVMIKRIDQQIRVNKLMVDVYNRNNFTNKRMRAYMFNYLDIITTISSIMLIRAETEEALEKKKALLEYIRGENRILYSKLRHSLFGRVMNLLGRGGRKCQLRPIRSVRSFTDSIKQRTKTLQIPSLWSLQRFIGEKDSNNGNRYPFCCLDGRMRGCLLFRRRAEDRRSKSEQRQSRAQTYVNDRMLFQEHRGHDNENGKRQRRVLHDFFVLQSLTVGQRHMDGQRVKHMNAGQDICRCIGAVKHGDHIGKNVVPGEFRGAQVLYIGIHVGDDQKDCHTHHQVKTS